MIARTFNAPLPRLAASRPTGSRCLVTADRMYSADGDDALSDAAVLVDGDRILAAGNRGEIDDSGSVEHLHFADCTLLPGLIDAHVHLCLSHGENIMDHMERVSEQEALQRAREAAASVLAAGTTTVRDLGCRGRLGQELRDEVLAGDSRGPRILASGQPITSSKGHFWPIGIEINGAEDAMAAVTELDESGADLIKIMATGGALTPGTHMGRAQFDAETFDRIARTAEARGLPVAAHAHGTEGILLVVDAGVHTIEHCSWTDKEGSILAPDDAALNRMRAAGQMIVMAGPLPPGILEHVDRTALKASTSPHAARYGRMTTLWTNSRHALQRGVGVALGTDSMFGEFENGHDLIYRGEALVRFAGWQPKEVLQAMTTAGARALCAQGRIGTIAPGAFADFLVVSGAPDMNLADLHNTVAVFLGGSRVV